MNTPTRHAAILQCEEGDDPTLVEQLRAVIRGVVRTTMPPEVYVVRIDNWFGDRWLGFRSKYVGAMRWADREGNYRIPPFVPGRVVAQHFFVLTGDGAYEEREAPRELHRRQPSEGNNCRSIELLVPRACLVWVSGNSAANDDASIMVYEPGPDGHTAWYASMRREHGGAWRCVRGVHVTQEMLEHLASKGQD